MKPILNILNQTITSIFQTITWIQNNSKLTRVVLIVNIYETSSKTHSTRMHHERAAKTLWHLKTKPTMTTPSTYSILVLLPEKYSALNVSVSRVWANRCWCSDDWRNVRFQSFPWCISVVQPYLNLSGYKSNKKPHTKVAHETVSNITHRGSVYMSHALSPLNITQCKTHVKQTKNNERLSSTKRSILAPNSLVSLFKVT